MVCWLLCDLLYMLYVTSGKLILLKALSNGAHGYNYIVGMVSLENVDSRNKQNGTGESRQARR